MALIAPKKLDEWVTEVENRPDPPWILKNLLHGEAMTLVTGPATRGHKTWFAMACALAVASGKKFQCLEPVEPMPVLYCLQEGPAKPSANRFRKLERGLNVSIKDLPIQFSHRRPFFLDDELDVGHICKLVKNSGTRLVVIDTLARVNRGDENSSRDMGAAMHGLGRIREQGASVMYLHHIGKPPGEKTGPRDIDDESRGSSALAGAYDIHFAFRKNFETQKHLDLTVRANQFAERYYSIQWYVDKEDAGQTTFDMFEVEPGAVADAMKDELIAKLTADRGYTQSELARVWELKTAQVKYLIGKLLEEKSLKYEKKQYWLP